MLGTGMLINLWAPYCLCWTVKKHSRKTVVREEGQHIKMIAGFVIRDRACQFCVIDFPISQINHYLKRHLRSSLEKDGMLSLIYVCCTKSAFALFQIWKCLEYAGQASSVFFSVGLSISLWKRLPSRNMLMLENICVAFINMHCTKVLSPVAGLLLPRKKVPQSRVVKEV